MKLTILLLAYVACVVGNAGFILADDQAFCNSLGPGFCSKYYREDLAFDIGESLFPPMWIWTPFATGFYEHGWQLRRIPEGK